MNSPEWPWLPGRWPADAALAAGADGSWCWLARTVNGTSAEISSQSVLPIFAEARTTSAAPAMVGNSADGSRLNGKVRSLPARVACTVPAAADPYRPGYTVKVVPDVLPVR